MRESLHLIIDATLIFCLTHAIPKRLIFLGKCGNFNMTDYLGRKYPLNTMADTIFEVLCSQISADYLSIIRSEILPEISSEFEIGVREIRMLLMIDYNDDLTSSAFLAGNLRYDPGTVTRASKRLVAAGYIARRKSANDRRTLYFELTPKGQELACNYRTHIRNRYTQLENASGEFLTDEDRSAILNVLAKLRNRSEALAQVDLSVPASILKQA